MTNSKLLLIGLALATSLLTSCATAPSEPQHACPPVVQYSQDFMDTAAEELGVLGEMRNYSVIVEMMKDYAVMREQARVCQ